jgi:hypothetical protein
MMQAHRPQTLQHLAFNHYAKQTKNVQRSLGKVLELKHNLMAKLTYHCIFFSLFFCIIIGKDGAMNFFYPELLNKYKIFFKINY